MALHLRIIRLLADGERHSGEEIAESLGVSRAAVSKAARKAADQLGIRIETVRGHGYRLSSPLELLEPQRVLALIDPEVGKGIARLEIRDDIDSTNSHLLRAAAAGAPAGCVCLAERQTDGRGRRGRQWISPFGSNIYLSLLWRYPFGPAGLGGLSLAAGSAVAAVLEQSGAYGITLKWPNDVLWQGRKLAGLLLEVAGEAHGPSHVVIGVGVNLHLDPEQGSAIDQPWVDLSTALGQHDCSRNLVAARLITRLLRVLEVYGREGLAPFLPEWKRFDRMHGRQVEIRIGDHRTPGAHLGIDEQGGLMLKTADGVRHFQAGEVSLREVVRSG